MQIQLDKPIFEVGSEKRFEEFISSLNDKDKIALISHTDTDGLASAKIVSEVINPDYIKLVDYNEINQQLVENLRERKITKLIVTDLMINETEFAEQAEKSMDVLWIDHHKIIKDFNSEKTIFLNAQGYCATYLANYLFSKIENLEKYDWLVACACLSDFMIQKNRDWLKRVFEKYNDKSEIKPMSEEKSPLQDMKRDLEFAIINFKTNEKLEEMLSVMNENSLQENQIKIFADEVKEELDFWLNKFEENHEEINGRYLFEFSPKFRLGSILINTLSVKNPNKTIIVIRPLEEICAISMRRNDSKEDMDSLMKKILSGLENASGGGHIPAAGGHFLKKDLPIVIERLKNLAPK